MNSLYYKKLALSILKDNVKLILNNEWVELQDAVYNHPSNLNTSDFHNVWNIMINILLSDELGYTFEYMLENMEKVPESFFFEIDPDVVNIPECLTIPGHIKSIKCFGFYKIPGLKEIIIEEGITTFPCSAFAFLNDLKKITFPTSMNEFVSNVGLAATLDWINFDVSSGIEVYISNKSELAKKVKADPSRWYKDNNVKIIYY